MTREGHESWTAFEANLQEAADEELIYYAAEKKAVLVTTNKDCVRIARRLRECRAVYLSVSEEFTSEAMARALDWLAKNHIPKGQVLKVPRVAGLQVMAPIWAE